MGVKTFRNKADRVKRRRNFFVKLKKFIMEICNIIIFTSKVPRKFFSWASTKTEVPNCIISLPAPTILETAMEALPLLLIYVFSQGGLDPIFKIG